MTEMRNEQHIPFIVVPYDPAWAGVFAREQLLLAQVFITAQPVVGRVVDIQHMGSTAVPGLAAKPIVDMLVGVETLLPAAAYDAELGAVGYWRSPAWGDSARHAYSKDVGEGTALQAIHVHLCAWDGPVYRRALLFRDYLRAYPDVADEYACLKRALARNYPFNEGYGYSDGKRAFCDEVIAKAERWDASGRTTR